MLYERFQAGGEPQKAVDGRAGRWTPSVQPEFGTVGAAGRYRGKIGACESGSDAETGPVERLAATELARAQRWPRALLWLPATRSRLRTIGPLGGPRRLVLPAQAW